MSEHRFDKLRNIVKLCQLSSPFEINDGGITFAGQGRVLNAWAGRKSSVTPIQPTAVQTVKMNKMLQDRKQGSGG